MKVKVTYTVNHTVEVDTEEYDLSESDSIESILDSIQECEDENAEERLADMLFAGDVSVKVSVEQA